MTAARGGGFRWGVGGFLVGCVITIASARAVGIADATTSSSQSAPVRVRSQCVSPVTVRLVSTRGGRAVDALTMREPGTYRLYAVDSSVARLSVVTPLGRRRVEEIPLSDDGVLLLPTTMCPATGLQPGPLGR